jgi:4-hydroxybutyrate CoA-transferase
MGWNDEYERARSVGLAALARIRPGDKIFVSSACAEPRSLVAGMVREARMGKISGTTAFMMMEGSTGALRDFRLQNRVVGEPGVYTPWTIFGEAELMRAGVLCYDVAILQTSEPDEHGFVSLGISVDFAREAMSQARVVVAEVNKQMPYTNGQTHVHVSEIDGLVEVDYALPEVTLTEPSAVARVVAAEAIKYIPDGATIEIGIGRIMAGILAALEIRSDLGLHTGLITDGMVRLIERGNINNTRKHEWPGISIANQGRGSKHLYEFVNRNPAVKFMPASYTHSPSVLGKLPLFRAVNSALEVDLMGRVNSEYIGEDRISSTGGLGDFVRAAYQQADARSIIALSSTTESGRVSRIVPAIASGHSVTLTADLADIVVTEHGSADLRGRRPEERSKAMVALAAPEHRAWLTDASAGGSW